MDKEEGKKHIFFRWLVALPVFVGTMAYFNYGLHSLGWVYIEIACLATIFAFVLSWVVYGAVRVDTTDWGSDDYW